MSKFFDPSAIDRALARGYLAKRVTHILDRGTVQPHRQLKVPDIIAVDAAVDEVARKASSPCSARPLNAHSTSSSSSVGF